jgi:hypothetical protein
MEWETKELRQLAKVSYCEVEVGASMGSIGLYSRSHVAAALKEPLSASTGDHCLPVQE